MSGLRAIGISCGSAGEVIRGLARKALRALLALVVLQHFLAPASATAGHLAEIGSIPTSAISVNVETVGDLSYVADGDAGLYIYNVSNPSSTSFVGFFDTPGYATDVAVVDGLAYVSHSNLTTVPAD